MEAVDLEAARKAALELVAALKARDMATVARYAHPTQGVRFSPYAFVDPKTDQVWRAEELAGWFADTQTRVWGTEDGTGFDIERTPTAYYERFVFPKDFTTGATVSVNDDQARGDFVEHLDDLEDLYLAEARLEALRRGDDQSVSIDEVTRRHGLAD